MNLLTLLIIGDINHFNLILSMKDIFADSFIPAGCKINVY